MLLLRHNSLLLATLKASVFGNPSHGMQGEALILALHRVSRRANHRIYVRKST